jgi:hypothetical protein
LVRIKEAYHAWHEKFVNIKRLERYTIGTKIDTEFQSLLELVFRACFAPNIFEKLSLVSRAVGQNDILKFFLQIGWEHKVLDHADYANLILLLDEVGRQLGGWKKNLQEKTPAQ